MVSDLIGEVPRRPGAKARRPRSGKPRGAGRTRVAVAAITATVVLAVGGGVALAVTRPDTERYRTAVAAPRLGDPDHRRDRDRHLGEPRRRILLGRRHGRDR